MLVSQISLANRAPKLTVLAGASGPPNSILRLSHGFKGQTNQQVRNFRFGIWSSYLDPTHQKELQRRHRTIKYKYAEALNRKLTWDRPRSAYHDRSGFKSFMCSAWRGQEPRPGGRWVNMDVLEASRSRARDSPRDVEEAEQNELDRLLGWEDARLQHVRNHDTADKPERETRFTRPGKGYSGRSGSRGLANQPGGAATESWVESQSDMDYEIDPITNRKVPRTPKSSLANNERTEIPVGTFKGYRSQFISSHPPAKNTPSGITPETRKAQQTDESMTTDGLFETSPMTNYEDLQPANIDPDFPPTPEELKSYKPFRHNEPDGKPIETPDSVQESLRDYDEKGYGAFRYNEPDGKTPVPTDPVAAHLRDYDYNGYWPFRYNEPDGKPITDNTREGLLDNKKSLLNQSLNRKDKPPASCLGRGSRLPRKPTEDVQIIEPSLSRMSQSQPSRSQNFDPDQREDLDLLLPSDVRAASGILKPREGEPTSERQNRRAALDEAFKNIQDQDLHPEEAAAADKVKKSRRRYIQELELEHSELLNHNAHARGKVNAKIAELEADATKASARNHTTNPVEKAELTGNFVRDFPEEFTTSWSATGSSSDKTLTPRTPVGPDKSENDYVSGTAAPENYSRNPGSPRLQTSLDRTTRDAPQKTEPDSYTKEPRGLELSYLEECTENSESKPRVIVSSYGGLNTSKDQQKVKFEEQKRKNEQKKKDIEFVREIRSIYESSYGTIDCEHREAKPSPVDLSVAASHTDIPRSAPSGHDSSFQQTELQHNSHGAKMNDPRAETVVPVPTLYKILAYDATMQEINTAETTSIVEDTSSALTPAEVLLRLSNPAKFFPHFKPLQAQGYEIISGSGDVLVFRKVRDSAPTAPQASTAQTINPVNKVVPEPSTANLTSSTGVIDRSASSDFKSGIDVHREEPVFSGRNSGWREDKEGKKKVGAGRRLLIGAAWVGACSYAVGVVTEFFRTGGIDGMGPTGL